MKNLVVAVVVLLGITLLAGLGFIYSGIFNVAATSKDSALVSWILMTTRENSIERRSEGVIVPDEASLNTPEALADGFEHYNEMCVVCHGAPGVDAGEAREGLNPQPPLLAKLTDLKDDSLGEIFWVIKNGIKMTAMPAWGPTHNDEKIWAMAMFVKKLPSMSAAEYKAMQQKMSESGHDHGHGNDHDHAQDKSAEPNAATGETKHDDGHTHTHTH